VWFPITQLPQWLQPICQALPLTAAVQLARPLMMGQWPESVAVPVMVLVFYALGGFYLAAVLTRRRFVS
jgi:lipooligosaccharide transport system permease protein